MKCENIHVYKFQMIQMIQMSFLKNRLLYLEISITYER